MSVPSTALPDRIEPMATVRHYIESLNKGAAKGMVAMCAVPMTILDRIAREADESLYNFWRSIAIVK